MAADAVSSVDQGFDAIRLVASHEEPCGLADVARAMGIPTSTAHRILASFIVTRYLDQDANSKYKLGLTAYQLAAAFFDKFPIRDAASPTVRALAELTGETTTLSVRVGWYALRIDAIEGWREIHTSSRLGSADVLDTTVSGRLLLAGREEADLAAFIRWREKKTGRRRPGRDALLRQLAELPDTAELTGPQSQESERDVVNFPVHDGDKRVCAVITVEGELKQPGQSGPMTKQCRQLIADLERILADRPDLTEDPYRHLDPDVLDLPLQHG